MSDPRLDVLAEVLRQNLPERRRADWPFAVEDLAAAQVRSLDALTPPTDGGLRTENERLRAAVAEGDRRIERLRESIHPTMDGYCPACGGGCLIGFATPTPARDAVREIVP